MQVPLQVVEAFLRQKPPRQVPNILRAKAMTRASLIHLMLGIFFVGLGGVHAFVFFPFRLADDIRLSSRGVTTDAGRVHSCRRTNLSENHRRIVEYHFEYIPEDGEPRKGRCYSPTHLFETGSPVKVVYLRENPGIARIEGCRLSPLGWGAIFIAVLPLVGLVWVSVTLRSYATAQYLLRHGGFAAGRIHAVEPTLMTVNKKPVYRVRVTFQTERGPVEQASYRVFEDDAVELARRKMETNEAVGVLYDPVRPKRVLLIDRLLM